MMSDQFITPVYQGYDLAQSRRAHFAQCHPSVLRNAYSVALMEPLDTLAKRLKAARKDAGLTQKQLAKRAGCGQSLVANLESGRHATSFALPQLAKELGVSALWLSQGKGPRPSDAPPEVAPQLLDADFLYECCRAVDAWLAAGARQLSRKQRVEMTCYVYEMFIDNRDAGQAAMVRWIDRWLEFSSRDRPS